MRLPDEAIAAAKRELMNEGHLDIEHYAGYRDSVVEGALLAALPYIERAVLNSAAKDMRGSVISHSPDVWLEMRALSKKEGFET